MPRPSHRGQAEQSPRVPPAAEASSPARLTDPETLGLPDFSQPIAALMFAVPHFVPATGDPNGVIHSYLDAMSPGGSVSGR
ncbi:SAM-dependent methyltransferase [Lentzea alba]|uniref:SAM-dependent methyltransferase n=1 Tax=Lentzea alba TaxID=2714351 RepID=UPI0039BF198F